MKEDQNYLIVPILASRVPPIRKFLSRYIEQLQNEKDSVPKNEREEIGTAIHELMNLECSLGDEVSYLRKWSEIEKFFTNKGN